MRLCIALDNATLGENYDLLKELNSLSSAQKSSIWLKIGLRSFIRDGVRGIEILKKCGDYRIFLDLKLYDIPNTMLDSIKEIAKLEVDMLTIHTSCGFETMKSIATLKNDIKIPLIIGVSALTSFDDESFTEIYNAQLFSHTLKLSSLAYRAGLDGVVCSVYESLAIKQRTQNDFLCITPGIRPFNEENGDQKRVASLSVAKTAMSDMVVIGRPIYKAQEPLKAVEKILSRM